MSFHAFLSYSHRADAALAALLQRALERLGTPWWRRAPVRVFRDDATLTASAALWPSIEAGLKRSAHFVLLASPAAAASPWVEREVAWWLQHRSAGRLFIVATGGEIAYDGTARDFDWQRTTCLPPALRGVFDSEPLWVDLRFAATQWPLTLRHTRLHSAALALAAAVRGIDKDELESEDLRAHRRSVVIAGAALVLIGALALATTAAVLTARSESESARSNRLQAESRRLAADALDELARGQIEAAILKAALGWRLAPTAEAREALARIDANTAAVARVLERHTGGADLISLSPDGRSLATAGREGAVLLWDLDSGRLTGSAAGPRAIPQTLAHSRDGTHLLLKASERVANTELPRLLLLRTAGASTVPLSESWFEWIAQGETGMWGSLPCAALSASGAYVAVGYEDRVAVIRVADGHTARHRLPPKRKVGAIGFDTDDQLVLLLQVGFRDGLQAARLDQPWRDGGTLRIGPRQRDGGADCRSARVSTDGRRVSTSGRVWQMDSGLALVSLAKAHSVERLADHGALFSLAFDADGGLGAEYADGLGRVWNLDTRKLVFQTTRLAGKDIEPVALSGNGRRLAALVRGTPLVWALDGTGNTLTVHEPDCGRGEAAENHCLVRLCERLTLHPDPERWRRLLRDDQADLLATAQQLRCGGR